MTGADPTRRVGEVFDEWAAAGRGERMERGHRPTAGRVLEAMPLKEGARFLDLGTGNGWASRDATRRGARAVGVDVAPDMLRRARKTSASDTGPELAAARWRVRPDYIRASFERLPFRDGAFDAEFSMEALYYADDLSAALREVRRVLAPGGALDAVVDYYEENPASHGWPELTGLHMHLLSEKAWRDALADAGFRDVGSERVRTPPGVGDEWLQENGSLHLTGRA